MKTLHVSAITHADSISEYIYNFYLPKHLYASLASVDVHMIYRKLDDSSPDEVTIYYAELKAEKKLSVEIVREVLAACRQYETKRYAKEISQAELGIVINLNSQLLILQKEIGNKCAALCRDLENRIKRSDSFLKDFEINVAVDLYLKDGDPWFDDSMNIEEPGRMASIHFSGKIESLVSKDMFGSLDSVGAAVHTYTVRDIIDNSCHLFHALAEHEGMPIADMNRIDRIWTDINVTLQNVRDVEISIDLSLNPMVAQW